MLQRMDKEEEEDGEVLECSEDKPTLNTKGLQVGRRLTGRF